MPLNKMAKAISNQYGHKGAIILTVHEDGCRIGVSDGLTDREIQDAFCAGILYNMLVIGGDDD